MRWKQQSGQFRLAPANRLPLSSPSPIYLVHEVKPMLGRHIHCHHTQCHTAVSLVVELGESMKFIGKSRFKNLCGKSYELSSTSFIECSKHHMIISIQNMWREAPVCSYLTTSTLSRPFVSLAIAKLQLWLYESLMTPIRLFSIATTVSVARETGLSNFNCHHSKRKTNERPSNAKNRLRILHRDH